MSTQAQLDANRANAQLSTGPKTPAGKTKVAHNAVKNALTGATVLLPSDDAALYEQHVSNTVVIWAPETHREKLLVQSIADTEWRLQRIPALETGTLALGRLRYADLFQDQPEALRAILLDAYILETKAREFRNLHLQERRLRNQREKDITELHEIQKERLKRREELLRAAGKMYEHFKRDGKEFQPAEFGFEFSMEEIEEQVGYWQGKRIACEYPEQFAKYIHAPRLQEERQGLSKGSLEKKAA